MKKANTLMSFELNIPSYKYLFKKVFYTCILFQLFTFQIAFAQSTDFSTLEIDNPYSTIKNGPYNHSRGIVTNPATKEPFTGSVHNTSPEWKSEIKEGLFDGPIDGEFEGEYFWTKGAFIKGKKEGLWETYRSEKLVTRGAYIQEKKEGQWETYRSNGKLSRKGIYTNGRKEGQWVSYYSDEKLHSKQTYSNGMTNGPTEFYHSNGQLFYKGSYLNGDRHGTFKSYYKNGNLEKNIFYSNGYEEGPFEKFYENGQLRIMASYDMYKNFDGPFIEYSDGGTIMRKGILNKGNRCGEWQIQKKKSLPNRMISYVMEIESYPPCPPSTTKEFSVINSKEMTEVKALLIGKWAFESQKNFIMVFDEKMKTVTIDDGEIYISGSWLLQEISSSPPSFNLRRLTNFGNFDYKILQLDSEQLIVESEGVKNRYLRIAD